MFNLRDMIKKEDLEGKIIFWDIDGTLAAYRFNGHIGDPNGSANGQSMSEIENGIFIHRKPSKFMQTVIKDCQAKQHVIMGHCICEKEISDKHKWLDIHYPAIKERILAYTDKSKADEIIRYCGEHDIALHDIVFVDDVIPFLKEAECKGIEAWHISSFLDYFINKTTAVN